MGNPCLIYPLYTVLLLAEEINFKDFFYKTPFILTSSVIAVVTAVTVNTETRNRGRV
jgi:hypothetical protein